MNRIIKFEFIIDNEHISAPYTLEEILEKSECDILEDMEECNCQFNESVNHCEGECEMFGSSKITGRRQFTGLTDKNGEDIYEGDVLRAYNDSLEITEVLPVKFEDGTFTIGRYWKDGTHDWYSMEQYERWELEIIGNIHQNPELL